MYPQFSQSHYSPPRPQSPLPLTADLTCPANSGSLDIHRTHPESPVPHSYHGYTSLSYFSPGFYSYGPHPAPPVPFHSDTYSPERGGLAQDSFFYPEVSSSSTSYAPEGASYATTQNLLEYSSGSYSHAEPSFELRQLCSYSSEDSSTQGAVHSLTFPVPVHNTAQPARSGSRLTLTPAPYQLQSHQSVQHPAQAPIALPSLCPLPDISLRSDITIAAQSVIAPPAILGEQDDESLSSEPTQITSIQPPVPSFENNPPSFQISESSQRDSPPTRPGSSDGIFATPLLRQSRQPGRSTPNLESSPFVGNQARNHSCPTCNKSFDRPSTLRKHLRVHTGEQPFECGHCGRRFQNTSNLNRHERRCNPKLDTHEENAHAEVVENDPTKSQDAAPSLKKRHRRNRKQENWIPPSLRGFNLIPDEFCVAAPIPLPLAVFGSTSELDGVREERDSSATQAHSNPYSEEGWTGRLPGPASKPRNAEVLTWFPYGNGRPSGTTRAPAPEALKKAGFLQAF